MRFVTPKKSLGQHFLNDISIAKKIVGSLSPCQNILEIGPGTGILTQFLINKNNNTNFQYDDLSNIEDRVGEPKKTLRNFLLDQILK